MSSTGNGRAMTPERRIAREAQTTYHEGKSPAAWVGSMIALVGFLILTWTSTFGFDDFGWMGVLVPSLVVLAGGLVTLVMKTQGYGTPSRVYSSK
ncbi:HGxxPAAW family protein [Luteococcus peritonei]|uniref:HGxxPAAW family protein n=1 Tax=Luteococcus peritonei TaxID=88874 RepID=A0ABW4RYJ7_9ACTN